MILRHCRPRECCLLISGRVSDLQVVLLDTALPIRQAFHALHEQVCPITALEASGLPHDAWAGQPLLIATLSSSLATFANFQRVLTMFPLC